MPDLKKAAKARSGKTSADRYRRMEEAAVKPKAAPKPKVKPKKSVRQSIDDDWWG